MSDTVCLNRANELDSPKQSLQSTVLPNTIKDGDNSKKTSTVDANYSKACSPKSIEPLLKFNTQGNACEVKKVNDKDIDDSSSSIVVVDDTRNTTNKSNVAKINCTNITDENEKLKNENVSCDSNLGENLSTFESETTKSSSASESVSCNSKCQTENAFQTSSPQIQNSTVENTEKVIDTCKKQNCSIAPSILDVSSSVQNTVTKAGVVSSQLSEKVLLPNGNIPESDESSSPVVLSVSQNEKDSDSEHAVEEESKPGDTKTSSVVSAGDNSEDVDDSGTATKMRNTLNIEADEDRVAEQVEEGNVTVQQMEISSVCVGPVKSQTKESSKPVDISKLQTVESSKPVEISKSQNHKSSKPVDTSKSQTLESSKPVDISKSQNHESSKSVDIPKSQTLELSKPVEISKSQTLESSKLVEISKSQTLESSKPVEISKLQTLESSKPVEISKPQTHESSKSLEISPEIQEITASDSLDKEQCNPVATTSREVQKSEPCKSKLEGYGQRNDTSMEDRDSPKGESESVVDISVSEIINIDKETITPVADSGSKSIETDVEMSEINDDANETIDVVSSAKCETNKAVSKVDDDEKMEVISADDPSPETNSVKLDSKDSNETVPNSIASGCSADSDDVSESESKTNDPDQAYSCKTPCDIDDESSSKTDEKLTNRQPQAEEEMDVTEENLCEIVAMEDDSNSKVTEQVSVKAYSLETVSDCEGSDNLNSIKKQHVSKLSFETDKHVCTEKMSNKTPDKHECTEKMSNKTPDHSEKHYSAVSASNTEVKDCSSIETNVVVIESKTENDLTSIEGSDNSQDKIVNSGKKDMCVQGSNKEKERKVSEQKASGEKVCFKDILKCNMNKSVISKDQTENVEKVETIVIEDGENYGSGDAINSKTDISCDKQEVDANKCEIQRENKDNITCLPYKLEPDCREGASDSSEPVRKRNLSESSDEAPSKRSRLDTVINKLGDHVGLAPDDACAAVVDSDDEDETQDARKCSTSPKAEESPVETKGDSTLMLDCEVLGKLLISNVKSYLNGYKTERLDILEKRMENMLSAAKLWKKTALHLEKSVKLLTDNTKTLDRRKAHLNASKQSHSRSIGVQASSVITSTPDKNHVIKSPKATNESTHRSSSLSLRPSVLLNPPTATFSKNQPPPASIANGPSRVNPTSSHQQWSHQRSPANQIGASPQRFPSPKDTPQQGPIGHNSTPPRPRGPRPPVQMPTKPKQPSHNVVNLIDLTDDDDASRQSQKASGKQTVPKTVPTYPNSVAVPGTRVANVHTQPSPVAAPGGMGQVRGTATTGVTPIQAPGNILLGQSAVGTQLLAPVHQAGSQQFQLVSVDPTATNGLQSSGLVTLVQGAPKVGAQSAVGIPQGQGAGKMSAFNRQPVASSSSNVPTLSLPPSVHIQKHPAALPLDTPKVKVPSSAGRLPPKPALKISRVAQGIVLSWNMILTPDVEVIASYQLFAYQESDAVPSPSLWKKVGDVKALLLPMACTLTQFQEGNKYHFAVRALDKFGRWGEYSDPSSIYLVASNK